MWIAVVAYSTAWGFGLVMAYGDLNLKNLDISMTIFMIISSLILAYLSNVMFRTIYQFEKDANSYQNQTRKILINFLAGFVISIIL